MSQRKGQGQGKGKGRPSPSRDVSVSKALSLLLRHAAQKEGLEMNAQGYANVADVVRSGLAILYGVDETDEWIVIFAESQVA